MSFGDWELFKLLVITLREIETSMPPLSVGFQGMKFYLGFVMSNILNYNNFIIIGEKERPEKEMKSRLDPQKSKQSNMEKQVLNNLVTFLIQ